MTLGNLKFHLPIYPPLCEAVQVILEDLVKGRCEIHDDHIGLPLNTIQSTIQVAYHFMVDLDQLGIYFGNHADSQQEYLQRLGACSCCLL